MASESKFKIPRALNAKVSRYLELRRILKEAEEEKKLLQEQLEPVLKDAPGQERAFGPVTLKLIDVTLNRFDEKAAKEKLGESVLAPFYKESHHTRINVS